ncbi:MAG: hypothetical protein ACFN4D_06985 [Cardiobacterium sp.]
MTLLFPRRIIRFLLSLIYAAFFAWATWMSAFVFEFNDEDRLYQVLFCLAFAAHGCWLGARHARYVFRRESVHLDADGITLWHNDVRQWRALRLPWADVLDVWTDNIRLYRAEARLCLVWRGGKRVENVALRLPPGLYRLGNGKRCRNQTAAALLAQLAARRLPPPLAQPPVFTDVSGSWLFSDIDGVFYGIAAIPLAILTLMSLGLLVGLLFYAKTLDDVTTMLLLGSLFSLITLISLRAMSNGFRRWRDGCNGRIFLRLDRDGVHYWRYGMARYTPATIPWASINEVAADCWRRPKRGWLCTVNISWRPHANAVYLRHLRYNTTRSRDNREQTRDIAARIRANSPYHGQYDHLPRTYMDDVSGYTSFNPDNPP